MKYRALTTDKSIGGKKKKKKKLKWHFIHRAFLSLSLSVYRPFTKAFLFFYRLLSYLTADMYFPITLSAQGLFLSCSPKCFSIDHFSEFLFSWPLEDFENPLFWFHCNLHDWTVWFCQMQCDPPQTGWTIWIDSSWIAAAGSGADRYTCCIALSVRMVTIAVHHTGLTAHVGQTSSYPKLNLALVS